MKAKNQQSTRTDHTISVPHRNPNHPDFDNLSFDVYQTSKMFLCYNKTSHHSDIKEQWPNRCFHIGHEKYYSADFVEENWQPVDETPIVPFQNLSIHPAACALHYGASAFEGTKAFISAKGKIALFRPEMNAQRLQKSCTPAFNA